ncbi:hypothetical protein GCM10025875_13600 [Litorihabitans aurantiacus]|uniref:DEAD-box RNA helicase Q domain-containing protein n=1 Tax=Litorihabitans aurantiacus TaxID=1930061 RepID=A0AA37XDV7_9MICO|nr:hypothetical protein GCM10025875_13600 [Litorihabitans aurantiacus]
MSDLTFADLGMPADLLAAVENLGFTTPTAIQQQAIPVLLGGSDIIGVAQTGTGKTAAFGLPCWPRSTPTSASSRRSSSPPRASSRSR